MDKIVQTSDGTYIIDSAYMARVKQVVDAALDAGLFVIVNIHHDGSDGVQSKWIDISKPELNLKQLKQSSLMYGLRLRNIFRLRPAFDF